MTAATRRGTMRSNARRATSLGQAGAQIADLLFQMLRPGRGAVAAGPARLGGAPAARSRPRAGSGCASLLAAAGRCSLAALALSVVPPPAILAADERGSAASSASSAARTASSAPASRRRSRRWPPRRWSRCCCSMSWASRVDDWSRHRARCRRRRRSPQRRAAAPAGCAGWPARRLGARRCWRGRAAACRRRPRRR